MTARPRLCCFDCHRVGSKPHVLAPEPHDGDLVVKRDRAYLHPATPLPFVETAGRQRVITLPRAVTDTYANAHDILKDIIHECFMHFIDLEIELRITDAWVKESCPWPIDENWEGAVMRTVDWTRAPELRLVLETNRTASLSFVVGNPRYTMRQSNDTHTPARVYADAKMTRATLVLHHAVDTPAIVAVTYTLILQRYTWTIQYSRIRAAPRDDALPLITVFSGPATHRDAVARVVRIVLGTLHFRIDELPFDRTVAMRRDGRLELAWSVNAEHRWPHAAEYIREVAMVLYAAGLGVWPLMWLLDWLPGMRRWREIAKMRTIDRTYASIRRVLDARTSDQ